MNPAKLAALTRLEPKRGKPLTHDEKMAIAREVVARDRRILAALAKA